jgi:hypothetical protein
VDVDTLPPGLVAGRAAVLGRLRHGRVDEDRQLVEILLIYPADRLLSLAGGRAFDCLSAGSRAAHAEVSPNARSRHSTSTVNLSIFCSNSCKSLITASSSQKTHSARRL